MEYLNFKLKMKKLSVSLILLFPFFIYSQSLDSEFLLLTNLPKDTVKEKKCSDSIILNVNKINKCIDTTNLYYPIYPYDFIEFAQPDAFIKSQNLKILDEKKWYRSDSRSSNDIIRILHMPFTPNGDSLKLYSFSMADESLIKLVKKEMSIYYPFSDTGNDTLKYTEKEYNITTKKVKRLLANLNKLKHYDTFYNYGYPSALTIEFITDNRYKLIVSVNPEDKGWRDKYSRRITSKIVKWLNRY